LVKSTQLAFGVNSGWNRVVSNIFYRNPKYPIIRSTAMLPHKNRIRRNAQSTRITNRNRCTKTWNFTIFLQGRSKTNIGLCKSNFIRTLRGGFFQNRLPNFSLLRHLARFYTPANHCQY